MLPAHVATHFLDNQFRTNMVSFLYFFAIKNQISSSYIHRFANIGIGFNIYNVFYCACTLNTHSR